VPPLNLVGDYGGGGMMLAFGVVTALLHAARTGEGQVIDCAMTDGSAALMALIWGARETWGWKDERGVNMLDTGAHFYDTYETADRQYVSFGPIEPQFYKSALGVLGLADDPDFAVQMDQTRWPRLKEKLEAIFRTRTRDEWTVQFEGSESCFAPVLSLDEAYAHPHNLARGTFSDVAGVRQPAPAPRLSRTPAVPPHQPVAL
jgi:alpha-methylacyl-CoA racemase